MLQPRRILLSRDDSPAIDLAIKIVNGAPRGDAESVRKGRAQALVIGANIE